MSHKEIKDGRPFYFRTSPLRVINWANGRRRVSTTIRRWHCSVKETVPVPQHSTARGISMLLLAIWRKRGTVTKKPSEFFQPKNLTSILKPEFWFTWASSLLCKTNSQAPSVTLNRPASSSLNLPDLQVCSRTLV